MISSQRILAFSFSFYLISSLTSMAGMSIGAMVFASALIFDVLKRGRTQWVVSTRSRVRVYTYSAVFLAIACGVSLIAAKLSPLSFLGHTESISILKDAAKLWYLFWPIALVAGMLRVREQDRENSLRCWIIALGLVSIIGITQYFTGWPRPQEVPGNPGHYHATLFFGHHLSTASILIFPFFVALDLWRQKKGLPRWILTSVVILSATCLYFTLSRTLWVALPIGIIAWAVLSLPKRQAILSGVAVLIFALGVSQLPVVQKRFELNEGNTDRYRLWQVNLDFFKMRPWTGVGFRHTEELSGYYQMERLQIAEPFAGHAHNNFLEMLGGTGLLGTLAWLIFCAVVVGIGVRGLPTGAFPRGLLAAWLVFHLNGLTQVNFWEGKVMHQMMIAVAWSLL